MLFTPEVPALRRWRYWFGGLAIAEIAWFALLRPPFSGHFHAVLMLSLIPAAVVGYIYLLAAVSAFLDRLDWDYQMRQLIVVMLGLSVGFFLSALMTLSAAQLDAISHEHSVKADTDDDDE
jgi:hypothetical protein